MNELNEWTTLLVEQPQALPGSANNPPGLVYIQCVSCFVICGRLLCFNITVLGQMIVPD